MGDVALSESDMKAMQAQKDYGESSSSSSDWTDDEDSDEFDVHSEVEASQYDLAESMNWDLSNSTRFCKDGNRASNADMGKSHMSQIRKLAAPSQIVPCLQS
nr:unnamed protein product [Spirometra erinaceieuropaei]